MMYEVVKVQCDSDTLYGISMNDEITFDEIDLNVIVDSLQCKIRNTKWNLDCESEWEMLKHIKFLEHRIVTHMNGSTK